jgi:hypothetical protein
MSDPNLPPALPEPSVAGSPDTGPVLAYAQCLAPRPGILSVVGILSICFGALGALANLCSAIQPFSYALLRSMPNRAAGTRNPFTGMSLGPSIAMGIMSLLELGLAVYLIICGIILLRDRVSAGRHHLRYAKWKIPIALVTAVSTAAFAYELQRTVMANAPSPASANPMMGPVTLIMAITYGGIDFLLSIAYPIALLIVFTRASVRSYFDSMTV